MSTKRNGPYELSAILAGIIQAMNRAAEGIPFYRQRKQSPSKLTKMTVNKRYPIPFQGKRECERRRKQMEKALNKGRK